jgi:hypothetical protein
MTRTSASPVVGSIRHAAGVLFAPGQVVELRVLNFPRAKATCSGYFNDLDALATAAARFNGKTNVYVTVNPINAALLARASNRVIEYPKATTSDADVLRRTWFLIDFDPVRPSGVSSTDAEHAAALARTTKCRAYLSSSGWPAPVEADSGNGGHLMYTIDLANNEGAKKLVEACLAALDFLFSDARVHVDRTVFNAARIWKLYGTTAVKGDHTADRPHRTARILSAPDHRIVVPVDLLEALAALRPPEEPKPAHNVNGKGPGPFDVPAFIARHNLEVTNEGPWMEGYKWILAVCPWNEEHTNQSAFIIQRKNGALSAGCHHAGCHGKNWFDLRAMLEPGCYDKRPEPNGECRQPATPQTPPPEITADDVAGIDDLIRAGAELRWVWHGWIQLGVLNLVLADAGVGKTRFVLDLARRVRHSLPWPDGAEMTWPADSMVLWVVADLHHAELTKVCGEFDIIDTVKVNALKSDPFAGTSLDMQVDLDGLEARIRAVQPLLVVIDSVNGCTAKNICRPEEAILFFAPLQAIAQRCMTTFLLLHHTNLAGGAIGRRVMERVRSALRIEDVDPENEPKRRRLEIIKSNCLKPPALGITMGDHGNEYDATPPRKPEKEPGKGPRPTKITACVVWLRQQLANAPKRVKHLIEESEKAGHAKATLYRSKNSMPVEEYTDGENKKWWRLLRADPPEGGPSGSEQPPSFGEVQVPETIPFPQLGHLDH